MTHYLPYFTTRRHGGQQAVCGRVIDAHEHSPDPTCPKCQAWIDADEKEAAALAAQWDAEAAQKQAVR